MASNEESSEVHRPKSNESASQEWLDSHQYTVKGVKQYERIFGQHFISTGGLETTAKFCKLLDLKAGQRVLDVGCGIGGSAFHMAREYGVNVHGMDLSKNMISIARASAAQLQFPDNATVTFEIADVTLTDFPQNTFDVIYSRDAILHIADKRSLFEKFVKWLKPGGKVFISDYSVGPQPHSEEFKTYLRSREYRLLTPREYGIVLESAGLTNVTVKDLTVEFIQILKREIERFGDPIVKRSFFEAYSETDYNAIVKGWKDKVRRCGHGDHRWAVFYAEKRSKSLSAIMSRL